MITGMIWSLTVTPYKIWEEKKHTAMDPQAPQESAKRKESANKKMIAPFLP